MMVEADLKAQGLNSDDMKKVRANIDNLDAAEATRVGAFQEEVRNAYKSLEALPPAQRKSMWSVASDGQKFGTVMQIISGAIIGMTQGGRRQMDMSGIERAIQGANAIVEKDYNNQLDKIKAAEMKMDNLIKRGEVDGKMFDKARAMALAQMKFKTDTMNAQIEAAKAQLDATGGGEVSKKINVASKDLGNYKVASEMLQAGRKNSITTNLSIPKGNAELTDNQNKYLQDVSKEIRTTKNHPVAAYGALKGAIGKWEDIKNDPEKAKGAKAAIGNYIAITQMQGSFTPSMKETLFGLGIMNKAGEFLLDQWNSGDIPEDIKRQVIAQLKSEQPAAKEAYDRAMMGIIENGKRMGLNDSDIEKAVGVWEDPKTTKKVFTPDK
jgi:hypothetical protein